uniref:Uncharacterized protein n=1 Tax=Romanomermis culicivorax TaxID=13658 RepID=A0A915KFT6_ROMCU
SKDPHLAPATTRTNYCDQPSSIAIVNSYEIQNLCTQPRNTFDQVNTAATRITNNVLTLQTIDQIINAICDQLQAQQLQVQCEIKEQAQFTN